VPNFSEGYQLRKLLYGTQVTYSWTLPGASGTSNIFTVSGGNVLVTCLIGQVTTAVGATATTLSLGQAPSVNGTAETTGISTAAAITSSEAGVWITLGGASTVSSNIIAPAELAVGSYAGFTPTLAAAFPVATGQLTAHLSANAGGGVINWYLMYVPLDTGASVAAA
jgi:hypothetical protein